MSADPARLIRVIRDRCAGLEKGGGCEAPPLPPDSALEELLDGAFHAGLLAEEGRRPAFTVAWLPASADFNLTGAPSQEQTFRRITFEKPRPYSVPEIHRLAPAADMTRLLICVQPAPEGSETPLEIWGLLDIGARWWKFAHHETNGGEPPPNALSVTSLGPGELVVSARGRVLASLHAGSISYPESRSVWSGPVRESLAPAGQRLHDEVLARLGATCWEDQDSCDGSPQRLYSNFLERILAKVQERRHGGLLVVVSGDGSHADAGWSSCLSIKYPSHYHFAWETLVRSLTNRRRLQQLHRLHWNDEDLVPSPASIQEFEVLMDERERLADVLADQSQAIACLSSVDGAVVISDRFEVLGFGAEVTALAPALTHVMLHAGGQPARPVPIDAFGTRHRAAFRLCSTLKNAVAFVISQDGGIKAVNQVGNRVIVWSDIIPGNWASSGPRAAIKSSKSFGQASDAGLGQPVKNRAVSYV